MIGRREKRSRYSNAINKYPRLININAVVYCEISQLNFEIGSVNKLNKYDATVRLTSSEVKSLRDLIDRSQDEN